MKKIAGISLFIALITGCYHSDGGHGDVMDMVADHEPDMTEEPDFLDAVDIEEVEPESDAPDLTELPPGIVWVPIPAGVFEMGCSPADDLCQIDEYPRHTVSVAAFQMTATEITQAQYEQVIGSNPSYFQDCPDCPVESVSWIQAKAFCEAIGGRLPSEAEWEYAARAGSTTRYYCGDNAECLEEVAWCRTTTTHPVGEKTENAFGLYDVLGNVWEWVEDCWHNDYTDAPSTGEVWDGGICTYNIVRGGAWLYRDNFDTFLRVSNRDKGDAYLSDYDLGIRCARDGM